MLHEIGHLVVGARSDLYLVYKVKREWWTNRDGPQDGGNAFKKTAPEESFSTAFVLSIVLQGQEYPKFQEEVNFMVDYQPLFQKSSVSVFDKLKVSQTKAKMIIEK